MQTPSPQRFVIPLADFDLTRLPAHARKLGTEVFRREVRRLFEQDYAPLGGTLSVTFTDDVVEVSWVPVGPEDDPTDYAIDLLKAGQLDAAIPLLEAALITNPGNINARYNLGMALSDRGRLPDALAHLRSVVEVEPQHVNALIALGVGEQRAGNQEAARRHLGRAVEFDPENGYAQRNLAAMLGNAGLLQDAEVHFRAAHRLLPADQRTMLGLAGCLTQLGGDERQAEADVLYREVIDLDPHSEIAEMARRARSATAARNLRGGSEAERPDAVMYCLSAMERFDAMTPAQMQGIVLEIALLGRQGLDINDPTPKYRLNSLPGEFSGLSLVSMMYVGMKRIAPAADPSIDLSKEYASALALFRPKRD